MAVTLNAISSLATAAGTLVLAVATFQAVRSSNRSARIAEQALITGLRPLLVPSLRDAPVQKLLWRGGHTARLEGGRAIVEEVDDVIYLAVALRNLGSGIALLHGWYGRPGRDMFEDAASQPPAVEEFRRLTIDLYIPVGGDGYFEGAVREEDDPQRPDFLLVIKERRPFAIDLLYGDQTGGQRKISRLLVLPAGEDGWYAQGGRHWNVDMPDPR
jgi:hypothetical protein